jgi:hypothetical protein
MVSLSRGDGWDGPALRHDDKHVQFNWPTAHADMEAGNATRKLVVLP